MMGCLICSQDAGPGFPFLDRTDTRASVTVFLILSTPTNLIVDLMWHSSIFEITKVTISFSLYWPQRYQNHGITKLSRVFTEIKDISTWSIIGDLMWHSIGCCFNHPYNYPWNIFPFVSTSLIIAAKRYVFMLKT